VETRVRTPLGLPTEPQVRGIERPLTTTSGRFQGPDPFSLRPFIHVWGSYRRVWNGRARRPTVSTKLDRQKGTPATSLARVQFFSVSLDGFGTGEGLGHDAPFGHAGERLHEWMFVTRWWHEMVGEPGGSGGIDDAVLRLHDPGIGAEIMGAGKFGYPGWHEDPAWKGWWGDEPPFHTPVFVLTHHLRPPIEMEGGTTFYFLDSSPAEALEKAREAADGQDVRIGGGPTMLRDFLAAGLVDHAHIVVVPILLGRGYVSGTDWRASRRITRSRPPPHPAASHT
jgi:dihydrofolate reductase